MQSGVLQAGIAAAAIFVSVSVPVRQQDEKVVPVHEEPRHHLVFDGADARILDIQIPPGDTTLFHTHSNPVLYVNMSSSRTRSQTLGRDWSGGDSSQPAAGRGVQSSGTAGTASNPVAPNAEPVAGRMNSVTGYSTQPLTHRVNNTGTNVFRLIGIINRTAGNPATAPSQDFAARPEIENRWFRGYRWPLTAAPASHTHANPVALVLVRGRAVVGKAGKDVPLDALGAFAYVEPGVAHTVRGAGAEASEMVEVEIRTP